MSGKGGTALNVGFETGKGTSKGPSKALVDRLSKQPDRTKVKARTGRESVYEETTAAKGERTAMKVNPVTGKMTAVKKTGGKDMVREGSMFIPKEYLYAAAEAGLGNSNGMYSHLSAMKRELGGAHNMGSRASGGPRSSKPKSTFNPTVNNVGGRIHKLDTVSKPGSNIKQVVQGRSRSLNSGSSNQTNESSYTRQKGVVNSFGGCSNTRSAARNSERQLATTSKERKTGLATLGSCGGRSFIRHEKPATKAKAPAARNPLPSTSSSLGDKPAGIEKKLGSTTSKSMSSGGTNMSDREKRAAYFAAKFSKA